MKRGTNGTVLTIRGRVEKNSTAKNGLVTLLARGSEAFLRFLSAKEYHSDADYNSRWVGVVVVVVVVIILKNG